MFLKTTNFLEGRESVAFQKMHIDVVICCGNDFISS